MKKIDLTVLLTSIFLLLGVCGVSAQDGNSVSVQDESGTEQGGSGVKEESDVAPAYFWGKGEDIENLFPNGVSKVEKLYLYNVGKDMFLNAGGNWGTQAMTFTVGLPLTVTKVTDNNNKTYYTISGPFSNPSTGDSSVGDYLGRVVDTNKLRDGVYWDRADNDEAWWTFKRVTDTGIADNEYVYHISVNGTYLTGNLRLLEALLYTENYNAVGYGTPLTEDNEKYARWKIVTEKEITDDFENTYDKNHPSDATFLIRAQNFNRHNKYNNTESGSESDNEGWFKRGKDFKYDVTVGLEDMDPTDEVKRTNATHGMFFNAGISGAETGDELYQTITIPQAGWYRLDCQGMFYNSSDEDECNAVMYAVVAGAENNANSSQNSYVNLLPKKQNETGATATDNGKIDDRREAGMSFYYSYYPNSLLVYVPAKDTKLEIGIRITKDMAEDDFAWFDNFELGYLGEEILLNEDDETFDTSDETEYKNRVLVFKRYMKTGTWNAIVMPVDLTKQQLFTAFFPNPQIAELSGIDKPYTISFKTIDIKSMDNDAIALQKGHCYILKPGYAGREGSYTVNLGTGGTETIEGPYYLIDRVSLNKSTVTDAERVEDQKDGAAHGPFTYNGGGTANEGCSIRFFGSYQVSDVGANAYVFSEGEIYHIKTASKIKGFRCWIEDAHQMNNATPAAVRHSIGMYINGVDDGTTAIEGLYVDGEESHAGGADAVYSLTGQAVRTGSASLEGLPKGVYVVRGKKYIIK